MKLNEDYEREEVGMQSIARMSKSEGFPRAISRVGAAIWLDNCLQEELTRPLTELEIRLEERLKRRIRLTDDLQGALGIICGLYEVSPWKLIAALSEAIHGGLNGPGILKAVDGGSGTAILIYFFDIEEEETLVLTTLQEVIPIPSFFGVVANKLINRETLT